MNIQHIISYYTQHAYTKQIVVSTQDNAQQRLHLSGLVGSQQSFVAAGVCASMPHNHIFILDNKDEAAYFQNDLKNLQEKTAVLFFPDSFKKPGYLTEINKSNILLRTETVAKMLNNKTAKHLLVSYPEALFEKIVNTKALHKQTLHMQVKEELDTAFIVELLLEYGFESTDFVYEPGQFSVRGGIIDIYSYGNDLPYRVELFGDEVESIRIFDPLTQLSKRKIKQVTIVPNIQTQFSGAEKTALFNILPPNTVIWVKDMETLLAAVKKCYEKAAQITQQYANKVPDIPDAHSELFTQKLSANFLEGEALVQTMLSYAIIEFGDHSYFNGSKIVYKAKPQPAFNKNFTLLIQNLQKNDTQGYLNFIFAGNPRQVNRFAHIFADMGEQVNYTPLVTPIHRGFIDYDLQLVCYTDHQIFDRYYKYNIKRGYSKDKALTIRLLRDLQPGDFVTHIDHGVGVYSGLEKITVSGKQQEAIRIIYRDNDILYVNINSLHKVSKYVGKEGKQPKVNKLGSDAWQSVKRRTKRQIKDIAADLIKLYAQRKAAKGFAFTPDTYLQTELEASFIYEDTPDQVTATQAVKEDMEKPNPMDRLICGDVGFGKTEIAVRAAAKAVADNKQVAILVPTTILALQHFKTFSERLKDYPADIDYINRFKTTKQKNETIKRLAAGKIDIVIGTHALASKKVQFKNLGLLIIDEEQKFGVATKEKLRTMAVNVDTLTLTATPIPRTLQFSLLSARDLSVISTPPPNRQPVETDLIRFDEERIKEAINYEVYRGGQVFFIHNRVKDIVHVANMIMSLCPDFSIGIAHGQLDNKTLESRMMRFIKGKYDVLVCTNIVETGLDVSNANTMIINNAHWFGLSDLHQLRGRVGRSNRKAFCYLITPPLYGLPDDSRKRLKVIEQFSELGDGFQVAMRDLDIRGAGNMLGAEQSGFISDIGYDIYHKILDEAIQELKENQFKELFKEDMIKEHKFVRDCQIDTDLEILIPTEYVNSTNERLRLYTELDHIETEKELDRFRQKMRDRFGPFPKPVKELFRAVQLRWTAKKLGFERILFKSQKLRCYFVENQESSYYQSPTFAGILKYMQKYPQRVNLKQTSKYLLLVFDNVKTVQAAHSLLLKLEQHLNA